MMALALNIASLLSVTVTTSRHPRGRPAPVYVPTQDAIGPDGIHEPHTKIVRPFALCSMPNPADGKGAWEVSDAIARCRQDPENRAIRHPGHPGRPATGSRPRDRLAGNPPAAHPRRPPWPQEPPPI